VMNAMRWLGLAAATRPPLASMYCPSNREYRRVLAIVAGSAAIGDLLRRNRSSDRDVGFGDGRAGRLAIHGIRIGRVREDGSARMRSVARARPAGRAIVRGRNTSSRIDPRRPHHGLAAPLTHSEMCNPQCIALADRHTWNDRAFRRGGPRNARRAWGRLRASRPAWGPTGGGPPGGGGVGLPTPASALVWA